MGLYAATRVRGAADFAVAGKRFGTPIVLATVFATWFGAETVLGIPATFWKEGLRGLVADPFAAVACLVIVGLVFARKFFRLNLLTLGDYFRQRYDRKSEVVLSLCIAFSYLGWIAAQFVALGLAFNVLSGGAIDMRTGIAIGAGIVLLYTMAGGMWSVALTDFFQAMVIIVGMLYVAWVVSDLAGGAGKVIEAAATADRLQFLPEANAKSVLAWISAALIVMFGSIPQQDVLQRVMSAKDESIAVRASILGGLLYFVIALIPIFLVSAASLIDPPMVERLMDKDYQLILPTLILERMPLAVQVLFFGALLSAILSTAGGALLAPSVALAENVVRPLLERRGVVLEDAKVLLVMRLTVAVLAIAVTAMALGSRMSIYQLVNESGKVVLVSAFVPLTAGIFWARATARGAHLAIIAGLGTWIALEAFAPEALVPPVLAGLVASAIGMVLGSLATRSP
ncbi:sodium:solute symporter family protein [Usitatibacter palustris]|uniref:Osmoregulated proline transporter OpuE n=1 Tax=Usitatibacter palustris TaxID=2732487 RepID=A0A6M4HAG0_9PROT|nr:sodium:solute symporter family protein [Usitatibacter palustris]QJR16789.1 Osmoregulated proline transporter OpuE [Usitatibacter palustris]